MIASTLVTPVWHCDIRVVHGSHFWLLFGSFFISLFIHFSRMRTQNDRKMKVKRSLFAKWWYTPHFAKRLLFVFIFVLLFGCSIQTPRSVPCQHDATTPLPLSPHTLQVMTTTMTSGCGNNANNNDHTTTTNGGTSNSQRPQQRPQHDHDHTNHGHSDETKAPQQQRLETMDREGTTTTGWPRAWALCPEPTVCFFPSFFRSFLLIY